MDRRVGARFVHRGDDELMKLEENLDRLTLGIPNATIDGLPRRFQRHTAGVSCRFSHLLLRVERAIMCYHEHYWSDLHDVSLKAS